MSVPLLLDIDEARSDNASLKLDMTDRTCFVILAGAAFLDLFMLGPGVELEDTVNVAGVPPEDDDAIGASKEK